MIDDKVDLKVLNERNHPSLVSHLGIRYTAIGPDFLEAEMPVDERTTQPLGILHGGANAALAETVGSMAAYLSIDRSEFYGVGLEVKCNHLKSVLSGKVIARAKAVHLGKRTHLWEISIRNEAGETCAFSTLTMAILPYKPEMKQSPLYEKMNSI